MPPYDQWAPDDEHSELSLENYEDTGLAPLLNTWEDEPVPLLPTDAAHYANAGEYFLPKSEDFIDSPTQDMPRESSVPNNAIYSGREGRGHQRMQSAALTAIPFVPPSHFDHVFDVYQGEHARFAPTSASGRSQPPPGLRSAYPAQHPMDADETTFSPKTLLHAQHQNSSGSAAGSTIDNSVPSATRPGAGPTELPAKQKRKATQRQRLSETQTKMLEQSFQINPRPDAMERERLVEAAGLKMRTLQVWFQNRRAKANAKERKAQAKKDFNMIKHIESRDREANASSYSPAGDKDLAASSIRLHGTSVPPSSNIPASAASPARRYGSPDRHGSPQSPRYAWPDFQGSPADFYGTPTSHHSLPPTPYGRPHRRSVGSLLGSSGYNQAYGLASARQPLARSKSVTAFSSGSSDVKRRKDNSGMATPCLSGTSSPQSRLSPAGSPPHVYDFPQARRPRSYTQPQLYQSYSHDSDGAMRLQLDESGSAARLVLVPHAETRPEPPRSRSPYTMASRGPETLFTEDLQPPLVLGEPFWHIDAVPEEEGYFQ